MKIERISENQLKLTLTIEDLAERNLSPEDLFSHSKKTQQLFREILEQVLREGNFLFTEAPLMVEAAPSAEEGVVLIITGGKRQAAAQKETSKQFSDASLLYAFATLDDVIHACVRLGEDFSAESALYKQGNKYFLLLQGETDTVAGTILQEYGERLPSSHLTEACFSEHGKILIAKNAVSALVRAFA